MKITFVRLFSRWNASLFFLLVSQSFFLIPQGKGHISLYSNRHDETWKFRNLSMMKRSGILSYKLSQALNFFPAVWFSQNQPGWVQKSWNYRRKLHGKFLLKRIHFNRCILIKHSSRMRNWSLYSKFHDSEILFSYPTESSSQVRSNSQTLNQYYFPYFFLLKTISTFLISTKV